MGNNSKYYLQNMALFNVRQIYDFMDETTLAILKQTNKLLYDNIKCTDRPNCKINTLQLYAASLMAAKWLKLLNAPDTLGATNAIAKSGNLEILKWAHANNYPWSKWTCAYAALNGHLEVLKWARENGCPWDENTDDVAASNGHLETYKIIEC